MKEYRMNIGGVERCLPLFPISEDTAIAGFLVIGDTDLIAKTAPLLAEKIGKVDMIMTAEAKGIPIAYEVSKVLGMKEFIVARKGLKNYMRDPISVTVQSITTKGEQTLYLGGDEVEKIKGRNICLLDDVISTGESLRSLGELAKAAGATVVKQAAILAEGEAAERKDIIFLEKLPLFKKNSDGEYEEI